MGYCNEKIEIWRCDCTEKGATDFDEDEFLEVFTMPLAELVDRIVSGEITDGKTQVAALKAAAILGSSR